MSKLPTAACTRRYDLVTIADAELASRPKHSRGTHDVIESKGIERDKFEDLADFELGSIVRGFALGYSVNDIAEDVHMSHAEVCSVWRLVKEASGVKR
jgi:hypothetical protein